MQARIAAIEYHLPENVVTNEDLASAFPEWTPAKLLAKTGIEERRVVSANECSSDLAVEAAAKLFRTGACKESDIDYILFCTQSPDYFLPTTACILQDRLGISQTAGALDFNLGCSGYVYGLGLAKGLVETGQAGRVLLITAETYSKFMDPGDKSVRPLFGDAAAATLVTADESAEEGFIGPFVFGTDGSGAGNLIVRRGGMREPHSAGTATLLMNGPAIFNFSLQTVPGAVNQILQKAGKQLNEIDLFVFHQANQFMLEHLRAKLKIPLERFYVALRHCGNTVSSSIPIALHCALSEGRLRPGQTAMLVGFGVGYSWGATLIRWNV